MTRDEHLQWCKDRALEYTKQGDVKNAYASFASDMNKHNETKDHEALPLGLSLMMIGDLDTPIKMEKFINDFN